MTISEIADLCGVSKRTVSRVINNNKNVRSETRERVLSAISEHNYRPNTFARNLSRKGSRTLLISIHKTRNMANTIWIDLLINELIDQARLNNFRILVEPYFNEFDTRNSAMIESGMIDGVVIFYEQREDPRIDLVRNFGIPHLVYGKSLNGAPFVSSDNRGAAFSAFEYLLSHGLTRSILISGTRVGSNIDRAEGAYAAYEQNGRDTGDLKVVWDIHSPQDVDAFVSSLIDEGDLPDVFFVSGDQKTLGVYKAISEHNLRIPDDVSVMGFDDIPISKYLHPSLTTVAQDFRNLAAGILDNLEKTMRGEAVAEQTLVPARLVIRESTR